MGDSLIKFVEKEFQHYSNVPFRTELGDYVNCKWYRYKSDKKIRIILFEDGKIFRSDISRRYLISEVKSINDIEKIISS